MASVGVLPVKNLVLLSNKEKDMPAATPTGTLPKQLQSAPMKDI